MGHGLVSFYACMLSLIRFPFAQWCMFVWINIRIYTRIHTYLYVCAHDVNTHTYTRDIIHVCMYVYIQVYIFIYGEKEKKKKNSKVYVYAYTHVTCQWSWWRYCDFLLIFLLKIILGMAAISVRLLHETVHTYIYLIFNYKCLSI